MTSSSSSSSSSPSSIPTFSKRAARPASLALAAVAAAALLSACGSMDKMHSMSSSSSASAMSQSALPMSVQVPAGNRVAMETVGMGDLTYECRDKKDAAGQTEWVFAGPDAKLNDRSGKQVGKYYGPPATWEAMDGSKITGTQVAVAPAGAGNIPYQLVKANPAMGRGAMSDITYIQRIAIKGGAAPASMPCTMANKGQKTTVPYQADYLFWKAA